MPVAELLRLGVREDGVIAHRAPAGSPPHDNLTGRLNPFCAVRIKENVAVPPRTTVKVPGDPLNKKPCPAPGKTTVTVVEPQTDPAHAVIVAVPADTPRTTPLLVESLPTPLLLPEFFVIGATVSSEELQIAEARVCVLLSLKVPVATKA